MLRYRRAETILSGLTGVSVSPGVAAHGSIGFTQTEKCRPLSRMTPIICSNENHQGRSLEHENRTWNPKHGIVFVASKAPGTTTSRTWYGGAQEVSSDADMASSKQEPKTCLESARASALPPNGAKNTKMRQIATRDSATNAHAASKVSYNTRRRQPGRIVRESTISSRISSRELNENPSERTPSIPGSKSVSTEREGVRFVSESRRNHSTSASPTSRSASEMSSIQTMNMKGPSLSLLQRPSSRRNGAGSLDWTMEAFLERLRLWEAPLLRHQAYVTRLKSLEKEEKALQEAARIRVEGRMTTKIAQEIYTDLRRPFKQLETNQEGLLRCLSNFENAKMDPAADLKLQRIRASLIASYSDLATTGHLLRELLLRTVGMRHNRVAWHHLMEEIYYSLPWKEYAIALGEFNHTLDKSQKSIRTLRNGQRTYHRFTSIFFKERAESFGSAWEDWIREVRKRREGSISPHQRALNEYFIPFSRYLQKSSSTLRTTELLIREWDSNCLSLDRGQFKEKVLRLKKFMVKAHRSLIPLVSELTEVVALKMEIQAELSRLSSPKAQDDSAQHPPSCQQQSVQGESGESSNDLTSPVEDSESSSLISEDLFFNSSYDPILEGGAAPQEDLRSKHEIPSPSDGPKTPQIYHRPLSYHMPEEIKRQALLASASSGAAYWRFDLYRSPEGKKPMLHWCKSKEASERVAKLFLNETLVGFDIEWKPQASANDGIKRNVSVIQVASQERIALFHIAYFKEDTAADLVPPTLKHIMESAEITKAGVAIRADCTRLRKYLGIESRGIFELSHLYKLVKYSSSGSKNINKRLVSLAVQVEEHLQLPLWKGDTVRSSDWTKHLSMSQIEYAASDSYAAIHLFDVLEAKRKALKPVPPCPAHAELNLPIRLADGVSLSTADEVEECVEQLEVGDNEVEDTKI